jgi:hypothetical protein
VVRSARFLLLVALLEALASARVRAETSPPVEPVEPTSAEQPSASPKANLPRLPDAPLAAQARDDEAPTARPTPRAQRVANRAGAVDAEPGSSQVIVGILVSAVVSVVAAKTYFATHENLWYTGAVLLTGAAGTSVVVCALGQTSPTRHGGCTASLAGALIGALGAVPGLLILRKSAEPCTATGPNADDSCTTGAAVGALLGVGLGAIGYSLGTGFGASIGWDRGATLRPAPAPTVASLPLLTVTF